MIIETMEQCMSNLALARSEIDRLRAENAELREVIKRIAETPFGFQGREIARAILAKTAKEGD